MIYNLNKNEKNKLEKLFQINEDNKIISEFFLDCLYESKKISKKISKSKNKKIFDNISEYFQINEDFTNYFHKYKIENSFKKLDVAEYLNNPYVKNIKLDKIIIDDNHKFAMLNYLPYELFLYDDNSVDNDFIEHTAIGYFDTAFNYLALLENESIWMLITPHEINTMKKGIRNAKGDVITYGLGLGYYAYMCSLKDEVKSVTIIERDIKTINLFKKFILPQFEHKEKITIINEDAINYCKKNINYDYTYVDLYRDADDGLKLYIEMYKLLRSNQNFDFWIEDGLMIMLKRCMFTVLYENYNNSFVEYNDNYYDYVINKFNELLKNYSINSINDIYKLLSDSFIKELIIKL